MTEFRMPSLGADMEYGVIVEWLVAAGDEVKRGDVVALVDTEKGIIDVEVWHDGVVAEIVIAEGEEVAVGDVIARFEGAAEGLTPVQRRRISPRARAVAAELGVDATELAADGPINEAAVRNAADTLARDNGMRRAIGRTMSRSKRDIPHYYLTTTIDMKAGLNWLKDCNAAVSMEDRIIPAALLLKATALAATHVTGLNGRFEDGTFTPSEVVHLGTAISLRSGGLVAPAIRDCATKPLPIVMREMADLVKRARSGRLRNSEVSGATLTVTNLGERGVEAGYGVIIPPQVAIVCFGTIADRPWAEAGQVGARPLVTASLSGDHRVSDGHQGGRFLSTINSYLQNPEAL